MSLFNWFSGLFSSGGIESTMDDSMFSNHSMGIDDYFAINPANGMPMMDGIGGLDVEGNTYGTDFLHDSMTSSSFDDSFSMESSSMFDDQWTIGSDSMFDDSWSSSSDSFSDW
ncbi:MAG: hypothetical protein KJ958_06760 [Gammaproteobacteria bacterium]|nr:hypothetical protein [Gammaproteobacteria bacterium]MBU1978857.1 hypothetical protein [Gammaproteobacteria bacterium]